jgi:hypothetical protein
MTAALEQMIEAELPDAGGPLTIVGSTSASAGGTDYEVSAHRLVALDPDDPELADVYVPVPVSGHVSLAPDGASSSQLADIDEDTQREVRAWARSLIANGKVAGMAATVASYGPPRRPTHELIVDTNGRRVLRRTGFVAF